MLTEVEARRIFDDAWKKAKPFIQDGEVVEKKGKLPDFYPGYPESVRTAKDIAVHVIPGVFGESILANRSPNQTEAEWNYIKANAKQVTLPVYMDFQNTIQRAIAPGNWELQFTEEQASADLREYITTGVEEYDSVQNFIRYLLPKIKCTDPMGLMVVTPGELPTVENADGTVSVDGTVPFRPQITYVEVAKVWGFKADVWYLYQANEASPVEYGNGTVNKGMVLYLVDDTRFWRIYQVGKLIDYTFAIEEGIEHGVGYAPADHIKGLPVFKDGKVVWQSVFLPVKDVLDLAYLDAQNLTLIKSNCVYPTRVMVGDECTHSESGAMCDRGVLRIFDPMNPDAAPNLKVCPKCFGGTKSRMSPQGTMVIPQTLASDSTKAVSARDALFYVEPSTANTEFLSEQVKKNMDVARSILHLQSDTTQQGGTQPETATNSGFRNRALIAFIRPIADQMFDTIDFIVDAMARMRYPGMEDLYQLIRPNVVDMRTEADLIADIKEARASDMPPAMVEDLMWQYTNMRYQNNATALKAFEVITQADRLSGMTPVQIQSEATARRAQAWEVVLHYSGLSLWETLAMDTPAILEAELPAQVKALQDAAKAVAGGVVPVEPVNPIEAAIAQ
jgi:hypothetical protein